MQIIRTTMVTRFFVFYVCSWFLIACVDIATASALAPFSTYPLSNSSSNSVDTKSIALTALCKGRSNDYAAVEPGSKCRRYYRCLGASSASATNGRNHAVYVCPGKNVFNGQRCVHPNDYVCYNVTVDVATTTTTSLAPVMRNAESTTKPLKDCQRKSDGYYQDEESGCRSYFYCSSGLKSIYVCPPGTLFDGQTCTESYRCPYDTVDCLGAASGYHSDLASGCRSYYYCSEDGHKLITLTCSDGKLFDGRRCVEPTEFKCPSSASEPEVQDSIPESYYAYSPLANSNARFQNDVERIEWNSKTRSGIHGRVSNNPITTAFITTTSEPSTRFDDCERSNGFFSVAGTECRNYYFCIDGSRTNLTCPPGSLFNGEICVHVDQYACPESQPEQSRSAAALSVDNVCSERPSGLYPADDIATGCRGYVYCRSGRQQGPVVQCSGSERFSLSANRCVPKYQVNCPSLDGIESA